MFHLLLPNTTVLNGCWTPTEFDFLLLELTMD